MNPDGFSSDRLTAAVDECMAGFCRFVREGFVAGDTVLDEYKQNRVKYAVVVVFPDERERWYRFDFGGDQPRIETDAPAPPAPPDAMHRIVASAIASRAAHEKSYFYLRAFSRKTCNVYGLTSKNGQVQVEPKALRDLLAYYLERKVPGAELAVKLWLDRQLRPFLSASR